MGQVNAIPGEESGDLPSRRSPTARWIDADLAFLEGENRERQVEAQHCEKRQVHGRLPIMTASLPGPVQGPCKALHTRKNCLRVRLRQR